jgi:hypothetical protein
MALAVSLPLFFLFCSRATLTIHPIDYEWCSLPFHYWYTLFSIMIEGFVQIRDKTTGTQEVREALHSIAFN